MLWWKWNGRAKTYRRRVKVGTKRRSWLHSLSLTCNCFPSSRTIFFISLQQLERILQSNSQNAFVTSTAHDDFDYRSILLWLSLGCLGVFIGLRFLKCFLNKSEKESEVYRISHHEHQSIDDDLKSSHDINW